MDSDSTTPKAPVPAKKSRKGFAAMSPEKRKLIAQKGGRSAQRQGRAHVYNKQEAILAGRKGGAAASQDRERMSRIGKMGIQAKIANDKLRREGKFPGASEKDSGGKP